MTTEPSARASIGSRLRIAANRPLDGSSLAVFRVVFGLTIGWEVLRYVQHGWIARYYIEPGFHFTYWPFDFVAPWPGTGMYWHFGIVGLAGLAMALGVRYRLAAIVTFLGIGMIFLLEQARYLNHIYLVVLLAFVMIFVPADRVGRLTRRHRHEPARATIPAWSLWLVRFQIAVPYVFGGIAKINEDWLRGEPLTTWLARRTHLPLFGPLFDEPPVALAMTYGGLLLDLAATPLLLWRRTRLPTFVVAAGFHLMNSGLFKIGIFPWLMMAGTLVFFPADWPRRMWRDLREKDRRVWSGVLVGAAVGVGLGHTVPSTTSSVHALVAGFVGAFIGHQGATRSRVQPPTGPAGEGSPAPLGGVSSLLLLLWVTTQVLVPLRHFVYPGNVHWTEEGHLFAWHMKLRQKRGTLVFIVTNPQNSQTWVIDPRTVLTKRQASRMAGRPDMMVQFAHYLAHTLEREHGMRFEIRAEGRCRLNDREAAPLVDPTRDLAQVPRPWVPHAAWISAHPPAPR